MGDKTTCNSTPWRDGYYRSKEIASFIFFVEGETCTTENASGKPTFDDPNAKSNWRYGNYGEAHPDVIKETGQKFYNVEISLWGGFMKKKSVLNSDGTMLTFCGQQQRVDTLRWQSEEEILSFKERGDPADALPCHYKIQPNKKGKLIWVSGAPGMGKSTSAQILSKTSGYVYYEGDFFMTNVNPYIPPSSGEPSLAGFKQNFLKGLPQERIDAVDSGKNHLIEMLKGNEYDIEKLTKLYSLMGEDITRERKRLGGDWVIAHGVPLRKFRDYIRAILGPDLVFVVLNMTKEDQMERVVGRTGDDFQEMNDILLKSYKLCEPAIEGEPNAIDVFVTKNMSRDEVAERILMLIN